MLDITLVIAMAAALSFWLTPMPQHAAGWIVNYGGEQALRANAYFRGYDPEPYGCWGSLMSPTDLGKIFWLKTASHPDWLGPCLNVDAGQRTHFLMLVLVKHEIVEIDEVTNKHLTASNHGGLGEIWVGDCPPTYASVPTYYDTNLTPDKVDYNDPEGLVGYGRYFYPYPKQKYPVDCTPKQLAMTAIMQPVVIAPPLTTFIGYASKPVSCRMAVVPLRRVLLTNTVSKCLMPQLLLRQWVVDKPPKVCYNGLTLNVQTNSFYTGQGNVLRSSVK